MPAPVLTQEMTLQTTNIPRGGYAFLDVIELGVEKSKAILIPSGQITDIVYSVVGHSPTIYITISSKDDIEAGLADWIISPTGVSLSPSITAIYFDNSASTASITLKVKMIGG
jgi:hypothetical protein